MLFNKAYKFRIYPNEEQRVMLSKTFGVVPFKQGMQRMRLYQQRTNAFGQGMDLRMRSAP